MAHKETDNSNKEEEVSIEQLRAELALLNSEIERDNISDDKVGKWGERSQERPSLDVLESQYARIQTELGTTASLKLNQRERRDSGYYAFDSAKEEVLGTVDGHDVSVSGKPGYSMEIDGVRFENEHLRKLLHEKYVTLARIGETINLIKRRDERFTKIREEIQKADQARKQADEKDDEIWSQTPEQRQAKIEKATAIADRLAN